MQTLAQLRNIRDAAWVVARDADAAYYATTTSHDAVVAYARARWADKALAEARKAYVAALAADRKAQ